MTTHQPLRMAKLPKPSIEGEGIEIEGWNQLGMIQSSGVTNVNNQAYTFNSTPTADYLRIPYANTVDLMVNPPNAYVLCRFTPSVINGNVALRLWQKYKQGYDTNSYGVIVNTDLSVDFAYNNTRFKIAPAGSATLNVQHTLIVRRISLKWYFYFDQLPEKTLTYNVNKAAPWDWVIGSYLNGSNGVILTTVTSPGWKWTLHHFKASTL